MRDLKFILQQKYETSRALVIGINQYQNASPLGYAVNDAHEVREILVEELGFEAENVIYLADQDATKSNILKSFLRFSNDDIKVDDRLFVFFAGHGHTRSGVKGEVGYLVPYDADMDDYSTFIRWDELTRNAELVRAKHILFVMDACYGGLAVHRDLRPGSSRFLRDMYQRFSRQVITAGKANEVVADAGGPLPNHSVFTGHFIEGIRGKAANEYGVITASGLMAYVYSKVANDINSEQTPHYGQFDGDGDFIISVPVNETAEDDETKDTDELITIPYVDEVRTSKTTKEKVEHIKELISSNNSQIKLHDFSIEEVRRFLSATSEDSFATSGQFSDEEFLERISSYEIHSKDLSMIVACLSHWANDNQLGSLTKIVSRACDRLLESRGGLVVWINLRWYPLLLLIYHAGIAALEGKNYKSLASIFYTKLGSSDYDDSGSFFALKVASAAGDLVDVFKIIPDHERNYTPLSEYLYKLVQPELDDMLFLGKGYEDVFDEFEILFALVVADLKKQEDSYVWGPIGRFGWKNRRHGISPFQKLRNEAAQYKNNWGPIKAGMFGGQYERFEEVAEHYQTEILANLRWL
ncbi:caspase family protein [Marinobacter nauticus]|uniref:caspase family protein n=1 Tax=Marinobacter nauticus TaxID=2743 RepID=UPI001CFEC97B|nr:caspase family protein [Marinobacter nauticus]